MRNYSFLAPFQKAERAALMPDNRIVQQKSRRFAVRSVRLYQYLCESKKEYILSRQFLRSATSIGANLAEAECAYSRKDFLSKVYIAFKECAETLYWLDLLRETNYLTQTQHHSFASDCQELYRLLSAITHTMRDSL